MKREEKLIRLNEYKEKLKIMCKSVSFNDLIRLLNNTKDYDKRGIIMDLMENTYPSKFYDWLERC